MGATTTVSPSPISSRIGEQPIPHRRWTRDEYYRAADLGLFRPDERLELIQGTIVEKMPQKPIHFTAIELVSPALVAAFAGIDMHSRQQGPLTLPEQSEPEPDVAVVRGDAKRYRRQHPHGEDTLLVVEVANTSLTYDREVKGPMYARAGIGEYWILNLLDRVLEVYRNPADGFLAPTMVLRAGETLSPLAAPDNVIAVADLLPDAE